MGGIGVKRQAVYFTTPGMVDVREEPLAPLQAGEVLVQTLVSAISAGTELLFYRGQVPPDLPADETIAALKSEVRYPLKYGYAAVGQVIGIGAEVPEKWLGRTVFSFHPHESHFVVPLAEVIPVPPEITAEQAAFLPNMETAITLVLDGAPLIGEQVAIFGQGIVGLLTTALLAQFPLASLVTLDRYLLRREASRGAGAHHVLDPATPEALQQAQALLQADRPHEGADLCYELSGSPEALNQAIAVTGYHGRVVIGSWYGQKQVPLNLGGRFHRSRIRLISSQVSTLAPELRGRWSTSRRFGLAWEMIRRIKPQRFITHRFPLHEAAQAYRLLDERPAEALQVVFCETSEGN